MESPFFRNRRWYEQPHPTRRPFSRSSATRGVPVYGSGDVHPIERSPERNTAPRVVRIPVQHVGSGRVDRSGAAVKIQKVFRGFLVRKCLRKIRDIEVQVDDVEERLSRGEVVEVVRRDERERLRMNESLMSLLFKLDSICGLDFGVRVCRKAVIRKAIALQERIDAIVAVNSVENCGNGGGECEEAEIRVSEEEDDSEDEISVSGEGGDVVKTEDLVENIGNLESSAEDQENMDVEENDGEIKVIDVGVDREVKVGESNCPELVEENVEKLKESEHDEDEKDNGADDNKRNRELLERMMEDNEKMMNLMTQLCARNEDQTRMINALTHRVELLEKAFVCDRMRKKKKKKNNKNNKSAAFTED